MSNALKENVDCEGLFVELQSGKRSEWKKKGRNIWGGNRAVKTFGRDRGYLALESKTLKLVRIKGDHMTHWPLLVLLDPLFLLYRKLILSLLLAYYGISNLDLGRDLDLVLLDDQPCALVYRLQRCARIRPSVGAKP